MSILKNPFDANIAETLEAQRAALEAAHSARLDEKASKSFQDEPFSTEWSGVYSTAIIGQSLSQLVTFIGTATIVAYILQSVIPTAVGAILAVIIGCLVAFGVERVKRATLRIAAKHLLKYKKIGFGLGIVIAVLMSVSIAASIYGAIELPQMTLSAIDSAKGGTTPLSSGKHSETLQKDVDALQNEITAAEQKRAGKSGWQYAVAGKNIARLQNQRAKLIDRRDATAESEGAKEAETTKTTSSERASLIAKMQTYTVSISVFFELVFLCCTLFILYYQFRHYTDITKGGATLGAVDNSALYSQTSGVQDNGISQNTAFSAPTTPPIVPRNPIGFRMAQRDADALRDALRDGVSTALESPETEAVDLPQKSDKKWVVLECANVTCGKEFERKTTFQKYCCENCRVENWERSTGKVLKRRGVLSAMENEDREQTARAAFAELEKWLLGRELYSLQKDFAKAAEFNQLIVSNIKKLEGLYYDIQILGNPATYHLYDKIEHKEVI